MDAELNPAQRLRTLGQSLWLDSINRVMLRTGALARYVRDLAVTGLTSNPTILGHAMAAGSDYDSSLARLAADGVTDAQDLVYALALEDLAEAAALFRPAWEQTEGVDGYVSVEVPPGVAYDATATVALARRLYDQAGFPNLLVKIPGTPQGLAAAVVAARPTDRRSSAPRPRPSWPTLRSQSPPWCSSRGMEHWSASGWTAPDCSTG